MGSVLRSFLEKGKSFLDHLAAVVYFLVVRKRRVAEYVEDAVAAKYPVRAYTLGYFRKVRDMHDRYAGALYFFCHHCAAARARSSGGGEDHGVDMVREQRLRYAFAELLAHVERSHDASSHVVVVEQRAYAPFLYLLAQAVDRH